MGAHNLPLRVLVRLTQPPVLTLFAALHALGMAFVAVRYLAGLHGTTDAAGHVVTGDFPAFLTAGRMLQAGQGAALYDLAAQRSAQEALLGHALSSWQPYAYPPLLALALLPSAGLPYLVAFYLHDVLMAAALVFLLWQLRSLLPFLCATPRAWATTALLVASFHPVVRTVIGGQNTVLSLALLAGFAACLHTRRPVLAGLCLGLLTYKPQLVPLLASCLLLRRQWLALGSGAATTAAHYLLGALFSGWGWPLEWLRMLDAYRGLEWASNRHTHVSLWALSAQVLPAAWAVSFAAAATLVVLWLVARRALDPRVAMLDLVGVAVAASVLVSPHVQYYDIALLVLAVLLGLDAQRLTAVEPSLWSRLLLALGYVLFPVYTYAPRLGVQPLCAWALLTFGWLLAQTKGLGASAAGRRSTSSRPGR